MDRVIKKRIEEANKGIVPDGYIKTSWGIFPSDWETSKTLGDIGIFDKGRGLPGDKMGDVGEVPCIGYGDIYTKYNYHFSQAKSFTDKDTAKECTPVFPGDLLFTGTGETAEEIGKCVCYNGKETIYAGGDIIIFRTNQVNPLFLAYQQYCSFSLRKKAQLGQGHSVVHIHDDNLRKLPIAFPKDKKEQEKIAQILMKWDEVIELQEQYIEKLEQRKKGLMKKLLTPNDQWVSCEILTIGDLYQPITISDSQLTESGYLVYGANGIIGFYDKYNHEDSEIAITCRGSTCGMVTLTKPKSWITGNAMVFKIKSDYNKLFLYYLCCKRGFNDVISGSGQPQITRQSLKKIQLCLPKTKSEQEKIASILQNADKEIALQNQYLEKQKLQRSALQQYLLTGIVRVK